MHLVIAKVNEVFFDGEAESVTLPGADGVLTVLTHHEPLVTTLKQGTIIVRAESLQGGEVSYPVESGVLEVRSDGATVLL
jgi:F-type H+-transporting ATPase subunit epsilon